jgi:hypothetical protein
MFSPQFTADGNETVVSFVIESDDKAHTAILHSGYLKTGFLRKYTIPHFYFPKRKREFRIVVMYFTVSPAKNL